MSPRIPHDHSSLSVAEILPVDGTAPAMCARPQHDTTLIVIEGIVDLVLEDDEVVLTAGDVARIRAGSRHRFFNAGDEHARIVSTYTRVAQPVSEAPLAACA